MKEISISEYILISRDVMMRTLDSDVLSTSHTADTKELKIIKELMRILIGVKIEEN